MASQQPPARPWFRLASIRPPPPAPAAPTPNPQPEPVVAPPRPVIRPAFSQPFRPPLPTQPQEPTPPQPAAAPPPPAAAPPPVTAPPPPPPVTAPPPPATLPEPTPTRSPPQPPPPRASPPPPPRASPPPPASPAAPPPTTTTTTTSSVPTSPVIKASPPPKASSPKPSSSLPSSPSLKQPTTYAPSPSPPPKLASPSPPPPPPPVQTTTTAARSPNPLSPPKTVTTRANTPSPSPKIRHISHPPSPLTLPPAQLRSDTINPSPKIPQEPEQKTILVQQTTEKSKLANGTTSNNSQQKYVDGSNRSPPISQKGNREVAKDKGNYKKSSDSEDFGMRIITIAGENRGAIMELSPLKKNGDHKHTPLAWSDGENSKKGYNDHKPPSSYVNSNVQGVNNSIIFNASCTHHDPGVHLSLSRNGNGGRGIHMKERVIKD